MLRALSVSPCWHQSLSWGKQRITKEQGLRLNILHPLASREPQLPFPTKSRGKAQQRGHHCWHYPNAKSLGHTVLGTPLTPCTCRNREPQESSQAVSWGKCETEPSTNMPKVTQQFRGRAVNRGEVSEVPGPCRAGQLHTQPLTGLGKSPLA